MSPSPTDIQRVIRALAKLSPRAAGNDAGAPALSISTEWFRWVDLNAVAILDPNFDNAVPVPLRVEKAYAERVVAISQVRGDVRLGWLFAAGSLVDADGRRRKVFEPLVSARVEVVRQFLTAPILKRIGDTRLSRLITDIDARESLEARIEIGGGGLANSGAEAPATLLARMPRLRAFAHDLARAAGFGSVPLVGASTGHEEFTKLDHVVVVAGVGLYATDHETPDLSRTASLLRWLDVPFSDSTALHALYDQRVAPGEGDGDLHSPLRLTPTQSAAVVSSRRAPVTVIQGAPGTGKSQALAAIALDAVARGDSVLVVAKTEATVDALAELLEQSPGPEPVLFGSTERRLALAHRLSAGSLRPVAVAHLESALKRFDDAVALANARRAHLTQLLELERSLQDGLGPALLEIELDAARGRAAAIAMLLEQAAAEGGGFLARRRVSRARRALREAVGAGGDGADADVAARAWALVRGVELRAALAEGGIVTAGRWEKLAEAVRAARTAHGEWVSLACRSERRLDGGARAAAGALATALRSGRAARREQLRSLGGDEMTRALPLWIGTLDDVDDLLPMRPALFDVVILDEAASVEQSLAAPALLRGGRAVVAGDPRQLRPVSFLADAEISAALDAAGITDALLRARLDARRNSALDVAVSVAEPFVLDEQFRSDPHLIEFVTRRLYDGRVTVAARKPSTHSCDCITLRKVEGERDRGGVVVAEIDAVLAEVRARRGSGESVGIITPFRAQADAIEDAVLRALTADELAAMDLRIGTVHGFQGNERDVVIASLGVGDNTKAPWHFVEDASLAAVMLTRARRRMVFIYSGEPPPNGLIAGYIAQGDAPPGAPAPAGPLSEWARLIADGAELAGLPLLHAYPTGRHCVDLVLDDPARDVAIETDIHPSGVESHIRRRLELLDRGWTVEEAYRSRWLGRDGELVVDLVNRLRAT